MSHQTADEGVKVFRQGALVDLSPRKKPRYTDNTRLSARVADAKADPTSRDAYLLATANRHKPWARRWLKERRYS